MQSTTPETPTQESETEASTKPTLGLQDLVLIAQMIQVATERGAWKATELTSVGTIYDKLLMFLESAGAIAKSSTDSEDTETAAQPQET